MPGVALAYDVGRLIDVRRGRDQIWRGVSGPVLSMYSRERCFVCKCARRLVPADAVRTVFASDASQISNGGRIARDRLPLYVVTLITLLTKQPNA